MRSRHNNQGMVLLLALSVTAITMAVAATMVMRAIENNKVNQRNKYSTLSYYEAEAGLAYAYAEESRNGFQWYTHQDQTTTASAPAISTPGGSIDSATGCFKVTGRNFLVKTFPEKVGGTATGMAVLRSKGTVNGISRAVEYRVGTQGTSAYKYFFFYPDTVTLLSDTTYDGRNYGGIHVNGDMIFKVLYSTGDFNFNFLTELSCGSNTAGKGYFRVPVKNTYDSLAAAGQGEENYYTRAGDCANLYDGMSQYAQHHFYTANINFKTGPINSPTNVLLPGYLTGNDAAWNYKKYWGTNTTPKHYVVDNTDLKTLANDQNSIYVPDGIMSKTNYVDIPGVPNGKGIGNEFDVFKNIIPYNWPTATWDALWKQWKNNHKDDYLYAHASGLLKEPAVTDPVTGLTLNRDWERRFFQKAYNWQDQTSSTNTSPNGMPDRVNSEWWEDMQYGTDCTGPDYMATAQFENIYTGQPEDKYLLNTEFQTGPWTSWLASNNLNESGTNKTLVQDKTTGGQYLDPQAFLEPSTSCPITKQKAKEAGIYIGLDELGTTFLNPISDVAQPTQFFNVLNTPRDASNKYAPSSVMKIDVAALKAKIVAAKAKPAASRTSAEQKLADFNGVIYVDLAGYDWSGLGAHYDENADAVMLVNAARLPDGGLSVATPNNIMIKGSYNLDPDGVPAKNRVADDIAVTNRYPTIHLEWQPAEIFSKRMIYTLSDKYPEPKYSPIYDGLYYEYYGDIASGRSHYQFLDDYDFPTPNSGASTPSTYDDVDWMPNVTQTRSYASDVNGFFTNNPAVPVPTTWSKAWADTNWIPGSSYKVYYNRTTTGSSLRNLVGSHNYSIYTNTFNFTAVHGADGSLNPLSPSFINVVLDKQIYNTAIITPYNTQCYTLEDWRNPNTWTRTPRVINGTFVKLPDSAEYKLPVPPSLSYTSAKVYSPDFIDDPWCHGPSNIYVYESRFGLNSDPHDLPPGNITFGGGNTTTSWREIPSTSF